MSIATIDIRVKRVFVALAVALSASGSASADSMIDKLKEGLSSSSPKVRIVAVSGISKSKDANARVLLEPLLADSEASVRVTVVEGLGLIGDPAALPALTAMNDDDTSVKQALARVIAKLRATLAAQQIGIFIGKGEDKSDARIPGLADDLVKATRAAIAQKLGVLALISEDGSKKAFGASPILIRSISQHVDGPNTFLDVKCDMLLVQMPEVDLRGTLSSTASVGVPGSINPKMVPELAHDAINACAPELADDFVSYVKEHSRH